MKVYYLEIIREERCYSNNAIYSNLEKAIEMGKQYIKEKIAFDKKQEWNYTYKFTVTEIEDLEYAESFDIYYKSIEEYWKRSIKPTHKVYFYDKEGNLEKISIEYRRISVNGGLNITMYPEDFLEGAGTKYKVGDIVNVYEESNYGTKKKIGIIRDIPKREKGQEYFYNIYNVISVEDILCGNGIIINRYYEKDISEYKEKVEKESPIDIIQRIIKGELKVDQTIWKDIIEGRISFDTRTNYKTIAGLYDEEYIKNQEKNRIDNKIKAKVIGVGGGASNITLYTTNNNNNKKIECICINTDRNCYSHFSESLPMYLIGGVITKGLGCGADPELGEKAVEESKEEIIEFLKKELQDKDIDIAFLVTCLGGRMWNRCYTFNCKYH